jgi:hypothetical protein
VQSSPRHNWGGIFLQTCQREGSKVYFPKVKSLCGLLAGLLVGTGLIQADPVKAYVFSVSGTVEYSAPGYFGFRPLKKGQSLGIGTTVRTGEDGSAVLTVTPGSSIQIGNDSILKVNELNFAKTGSEVTERKARLQLTSGVVSALIDPSTPKITDFQIQTPQGIAAARGTFYTVSVHEGQTYVGVKKGRVAAVTNQD